MSTRAASTTICEGDETDETCVNDMNDDGRRRRRHHRDRRTSPEVTFGWRRETKEEGIAVLTTTMTIIMIGSE